MSRRKLRDIRGLTGSEHGHILVERLDSDGIRTRENSLYMLWVPDRES